MAKIVVVTSGKGGVGKTTTSASFASGLALRGHKTAVIDFDVGLRNLDLIMGCERRVVYDLINVIHGEANLNQALIKDKQCDNLFVLAASQTRDKDACASKAWRRCSRTWPRWASSTSSAILPPVSKAVRSWPCISPTRRCW
jgi:septum site-determining protein MinD